MTSNLAKQKKPGNKRKFDLFAASRKERPSEESDKF